MSEQRSDDWHLERLGKITGSMFKKVMGGAVARKTYMVELATEIVTSKIRTFSAKATEHGTEFEDEAKREYEFITGNSIMEAGFILHPNYEYAGVSPDGLIGDDGGVEIKCPYNPVNHAKTVLGGMPKEHTAQVQGAMWVTGRKWWDFVSYCPDMPSDSRIYIKRIERDDEYIEKLETEIIKFKGELDVIVDALIGEEGEL